MAAAPAAPEAADAGTRLGAFIRRLLGEFTLRPHRVRSALRAAMIGTLGAGLMTAMHIDSPLGPYLVWALAGTPAAMLSWRLAAVVIVALAGLISASVILARVLCQSPPLMLLFLGGFGFGSTWLITRYKLGSLGLISQVVVFDLFYGVMFAPAAIGWSAGYGFAAIAVALGLITLIDNVLWPDPAEAILIESLAANLRSIRERLETSTRYFLEQPRRSAAPRSGNWRELSGRLTLLARARAEGISDYRRAVLLALITRVARLESETDVLALLAREQGLAPPMRAILLEPLGAVVKALAQALSDVADSPAALMRTDPDAAPTPGAASATTALARMDQTLAEHRSEYAAALNASELSQASAFVSSLRAMVQLLERPLDEPPAPSGHDEHAMSGPDETGGGLSIYSLKVAACIVAGFIVGLTTQRHDLSTIMTTVIITGLPTYGASMRKINLRIIGAVIGGAITIAAIIVTTPNFETVLSYMIVFFAVLFISSYTGQGSEWIAYSGKQIGTTFALVFVGLSPSLEITEPLWRIWGILLGIVIVGIVFLLLFPEYSGKSLLPRLRRALTLVLALDPRIHTDEIALRRKDAELAGLLEQLLAVAEDARMEGRASGLAPDAVIGAAGSLRRIAHRFERISVMRIQQPRPALDAESEGLENAAFGAIIGRLEMWQADFARPNCLQQSENPAVSAAIDLAAVLDRFSARLEADNFSALASWRLEQRRTLLGEVQSLRRLNFLIGELDRQLHQVRLGSS